MTTISPIKRPAAEGLRAPVLGRAAVAAVGSAMIVILTGFLALACLTMPYEIDGKLMSDLEARIMVMGKPDAACAHDGRLLAEGPRNCRDLRGFRIVTGAAIRVFSLRHDKPLFVFGLERGMIFTNEKMAPALLESEKTAFFGYMRQN